MVRFIHIFLLTIFLVPLTSAAQDVVSGTVREKGSGNPVDAVNVFVRSGSGSILGYTMTDNKGSYSISYKAQADSVTVSVTGFIINPQSVKVPAGTSKLDFTVEYARQKIREVKVTANMKRQSDTVTYYVESFRKETDRSIGEVLERLPGIEVTADGGIKYQGKAINKFYIEGLDMLGGRYGIATNNVQAEDIAAVEVYENHQPIKMLRNWVHSDQAAINLRLKSGARGTWNSVFQAGVGYKPFMWNGEVTPMYFGRNFQTISVYKTNNMGEDVSRELASHSGGGDNLRSQLSVAHPNEPPVNEDRYLNNNIHSISVNTINRLSEDDDITADISYVHDRIDSEGTSETSYFLADGSSVFIPEIKKVLTAKDQVGMNVQYRRNADKVYILERISVSAGKETETGSVRQNGSDIGQALSLPEIQASNYFSLGKRLGIWRLNFRSETDYGSLPSSLTVSPTPYPEIFNKPEGYANARQTLNSNRFRTKNKFTTSITKGRWSFSLDADLNAHIEGMESSLYAEDGNGRALPAADSMKNDMSFRRFDAGLGPNVSYYIHDQFSASLNLPMNLVHIGTDDRIRSIGNSQTSLLFSPSLYMNIHITYGLELSTYASWSESLGDLYDSYNGYIMTGYRTIGNKSGDLSRTSSQLCSADLKYGDALRALFFSAGATWWCNEQNMTYGTEYDGTLSRITAVMMDNVSSGVSTEGRISKRISAIATTFSLSGGWSRTWNEYLRQGVLMPSEYDRTFAGLEMDTKLGPVLFDYDGNWTRSLSRNENKAYPAIDILRQELSADFIIGEKVTCGIGGEHYFNANIDGPNRNMFFADASLSFKHGRMEYILEGRNLLNSTSFTSSSYQDMTGYSYSTSLRPLSLILKLRFSLR